MMFQGLCCECTQRSKIMNWKWCQTQHFCKQHETFVTQWQKDRRLAQALNTFWYFWISEAVGRLFICHYLTASEGERSAAWVMNIRLYRICVWYMRLVDNRHLVLPYGWTRLPRYKDSKHGGELPGTAEKQLASKRTGERTWLGFKIMTWAAPESFSRTCELVCSKMRDLPFKKKKNHSTPAKW